MLKITKRGATYYVRGTVAGQHVYESTGCRTRRDADAWAQRRQRELLDRHALGTEATLTLAEAALDYMRAGGEGRFLGPVLDFFGADFRLADLDNAQINAAAEAIYPTAAPATINRQLITPLRAIMLLAAEDGRTPLRKFRTRKGDNARTRWLRPAEFAALDQAAGAHLRPILAALVGTGARVAELLSVEAAAWFPETGQIWLDKTKTDVPRMVAMPERARAAVETATRARAAVEAAARAAGEAEGLPETSALFRRPDGAAYVLGDRQTPIKTAFYRARDAAGLGPDVTPHVLRHTWATWYYSQTRDFGTLLDLGGWRSPDMAMRYRKIAPDDLADQLTATGWDFTRLGRALPKPDAPRLRLVT